MISRCAATSGVLRYTSRPWTIPTWSNTASRAFPSSEKPIREPAETWIEKESRVKPRDRGWTDQCAPKSRRRGSTPSIPASASDAWESAAAVAGRREERLGEADTHRASRSAVPRRRHHRRFGRRYVPVFTFLAVTVSWACDRDRYVERRASWRPVSVQRTFNTFVVENWSWPHP